MFRIVLKLILRNWWRNKTFMLISILSLTVGIACTVLLISFVSYEYGIEKDNPNRDKLVWVMQERLSSPDLDRAFMPKDIAAQLRQKYPEVEGIFQFQSMPVKYVNVNNQQFDKLTVINVDAVFPLFFPFELLYGNWEAFNNPNSILLSEKQAKLFFGDENPLGKQILISEVFAGETTYTIEGVIKNREQSGITFDALFSNPNTRNGGSTFLKLKKGTNLQQFEQKVKEDKIAINDEKYHFYDFGDALSSDKSRGTRLHSRNDSLLLIGLISAVLVLIIAIFNYVNLNFSRVLQQVKRLHTQKLMGAKPKDVYGQIFTDTFLTVFISFVLAMLLMLDLLPVFNQVVSVDFSSKYFYSKDFLPLLIVLVFLLTVIPSFIMSQKISRLLGNDYTLFFVTRRKQWISAMVVVQFIIAFVLIIGTLTVNQQVNLVKKTIERYKNVIEVGDPSFENSIVSIESRLKGISGIESYSFSNGGVYTTYSNETTFRNKNGEEQQNHVLLIWGSDGFIDVLQINQIAGIDWNIAYEKYPNPVFVNKTFADLAGVSPSDMIGTSLNSYIDDYDPLAMVAGVVEDFYIFRMEENAMPVTIRYTKKTEPLSNLYIRVQKGEINNVVKALKQIWVNTFPNEYFTCGETYNTFVGSNRKIFEMSRLLNMYSLISILLTCFGLFGITFYAARQRTKEIGIRKINGAKTPQLLWLLMKPMFVWLAVGFVIATPLAWWLMERWLQQFVYRVEVSVASFLIALLSVTALTSLTVGWHVWRTAKANAVESLKSE